MNMNFLLGCLSVILISCQLEGRVVTPPVHVVEVSGTNITLDCRSDATTSKNEIKWFFEQFSTNYSDTVVDGCVSSNSSSYDTVSTLPGECKLVIKSLDGPKAGRYTCRNGAENNVSALVGAIVFGPSCGLYAPDPIVVGNNVTISCFVAISGTFIFHTYISNVVKSGRSLLASAPQEGTRGSQIRTPELTDWRDFPYFSSEDNITFAAQKPQLEQWSYAINFSVNATNLPDGGAKNSPSYQFQWTSPAKAVMYPPVQSSVKIEGCIGPLPIGSKLTCSAECNPAPGFNWIGPNGTTTPGNTVTVNELGNLINYTCIAYNAYGSAEEYCLVTVVASGSKAYWSLSSLLLTAFTSLYYNDRNSF